MYVSGMFKKEVNPNAGTEGHGINIKEPTGQFTVDKTVAVVKPAATVATSEILVILDDSVVSKFMIVDMKHKGRTAKTELKVKDFKDIEAIQKLIKAELEKNQYSTVFIPITNTEYNKNSVGFTKLRNGSGISVNLYFDGHDEEEVLKRAKLQGIK